MRHHWHGTEIDWGLRLPQRKLLSSRKERVPDGDGRLARPHFSGALEVGHGRVLGRGRQLQQLVVAAAAAAAARVAAAGVTAAAAILVQVGRKEGCGVRIDSRSGSVAVVGLSAAVLVVVAQSDGDLSAVGKGGRHDGRSGQDRGSAWHRVRRQNVVVAVVTVRHWTGQNEELIGSNLVIGRKSLPYNVELWHWRGGGGRGGSSGTVVSHFP